MFGKYLEYWPLLNNGVSVITACRNREKNLHKAIISWLSFETIDQIIILDWSSNDCLYEKAPYRHESKVVFIRVNKEPRWILTHAYNLAARFAGYDKILKLDADIMLLPGFFDNHSLQDNAFFSGNGHLARNDNERYLNGIVYLKKHDFFSIGGYNEYITSYGWDDGDLYERLQIQGLKRENINNDFVYHIPHNGRHNNQPSIWPELNLSNRDISYMKNLMNRMLASRLLKWDRNKKMRDYSVKKLNKNYYVCQASSLRQNQVPSKILFEAENMAFKERLCRETDVIYHPLFESLSFDQTKEILGFLLDSNHIRSHKEKSDYLSEYFDISK